MVIAERSSTLDRAYVLFNERRIDQLLALMVDDVRWPDVANGVELKGVRLACPAANPWPVARCEIKPASVRSENRGRLRIAVRSDVMATPPAVVHPTNRHHPA